MGTIVKLKYNHLPAESHKMDTETALSELRNLCAVISEPDKSVPIRYLTPWRGPVGEAFAVVAPTKIEEIRQIIDFAIRNNFRLLPQGERTGLVGASVPKVGESDSTIIVSMERFKNNLEYLQTDRRVIVDAGYTLDEVNEYLKPFGVHVPINVSSNPMIGGAVATNIGGSRVVKFGDARKLLLGVEVVLADEEKSVYSTLTKPRKDNSAPDFTGVFCGSFGSLGIITSAAFETFPIFNQTYTAWIALAEGSSLSELLRVVEQQSEDKLLACEFVSKEAVEIIGGFHELSNSLPLQDLNADLVFIEWGSVSNSEQLSEFAEGILGYLNDRDDVIDVAIVPSEITWSLRHQFSDALRNTGKLIGNDLSVSRDQVDVLRDRIREKLQDIDPELKMRDFGHLGDGGLHVNVIVENQNKIASWTEENSIEIRKVLGEIAASLGGSFSAEHGLGSFNFDMFNSLVDKTTRKLVKDFKNQCDPKNVLGHSSIVFS